MASIDMICENVDEGDFDTRYLAGTLSPEDAEAFEEHYFGCDRCWGLVENGMTLRAVGGEGESSEDPAADDLAVAAVIPILRPVAGRRFLRVANAGRVGVMAAAVALLAIGIARFIPRERPDAPDAERGPQLSIPVTASRPSADSLVASWPRVAGAVRYRSRLYTASGTLLAERASGDTTTVQIASRLPRRNRAGQPSHKNSAQRLFWNVEALDARGTVIAKSSLTPAFNRQ